MRVFVIGYPSAIGGANTELWHTVKLWRRFGCDVALLPTWQADPAWQLRLENLGCRTIESQPDDLDQVPGLAGGIVVVFCNTRFLAAAERFRRLGCRVVWLGCMNWLFPEERLHYRQVGPFARHVFQSRYQHDELTPQLRPYGYEDGRGRIIRGAWDADELAFAPRPHAAGDVFVVGRVSRADPDKFSPTLWKTYGRIPHPIRARVLGWQQDIQARLGPPPPWAECFPAGAQTPAQLLHSLHALVQANAAAVENWPRVGLEAMAAGVPLVVDAKGGWQEMIRHGETGYLCTTDDQFAYYAARLAYDEEHRRQLIRQARHALLHELAEPRAIWSQWQALFEELS
jgi:glycosyltransferase involved in cell wall biosynthesis